MKLTVLPLTPKRWSDLETLFAARGCSVARHCWCTYYRQSGPPEDVPAGASRSGLNRARLKDLVDRGTTPGLIGYRGTVPVGWVSLGPRSEFARLVRSPVMKPVDARPVWSIICFVVPPLHRGLGVARALLDGAIDFARRSGADVLEAYPVDRAGRSSDDTMWFGAKSMYDRAGFREVARRRPQRPVVRLVLSP